MKILITGGCGFVGSNLAVYLKNKLKKKCLIYSLDNVKKDSSKLNEKRLKILE
jgi:CDP-paratose 2-epimerase